MQSFPALCWMQLILLLMSCVKKSATLRPRNKQKTETVRCGVEIHNFDIDAVTNTQYLKQAPVLLITFANQ